MSEFVAVREACEILRVSRRTLYAWIKDGRIAKHTVGGRKILLRRVDVMALVQEVS